MICLHCEQEIELGKRVFVIRALLNEGWDILHRRT